MAEDLNFSAGCDNSPFDKAMRRLEDSAEKTARRVTESLSKAGSHGGFHDFMNKRGGTGNAVQGIKDLGEGRTFFGVERLTKLLRGIGPAGFSAVAGLVAVGAAVRSIHKDTEEANKEALKLETSFGKVSRNATFSSSASGEGALSSQRDALLEQIKAERELQKGIGDSKTRQGSNPVWKAITGIFDRTIGAARHSDFATGMLGESKSQYTLTGESGMRERFAGNALAKAAKDRSQAIRDQLENARDTGPNGDPIEAARRTVRIQAKLADEEGRKAGYSKEDLDNIKERYAILERSLAKEQGITQARSESSARLLGIRGSGASAFRQSLGSAREQLNLSRGLLQSGQLTLPEQRQERLNIYGAENDQKSALMNRYLNPDGSRRRRGDINRDFRNDAREQRRRSRFLKQVDSGEYDMTTGRRRTDRTPQSTQGGGINFQTSKATATIDQASIDQIANAIKSLFPS